MRMVPLALLLALVACAEEPPRPGPTVSGPAAELEPGPPPHVSLYLVRGLERLALGAYGGPAREGLDRLARLGTRFDTFLAPAPDEELALACLRSGRWPGPAAGGEPGLQEELLAAGYVLAPAAAATAFVAAAAQSDAPLLRWVEAIEEVEALEREVLALLGAIDAADAGARHLILVAGSGSFTDDELSDAALAAPLLLVWPEHVPAGEVRPQVLGHPDLAPTLLELVGAPRADTRLPSGSSLARLILKRTQAWRGSHLSQTPASAPTTFRLRATAWSYLRARDGSEQLYDLRTDAAETRNVATFAGAAEMKGILREQLREWVRALGVSSEGL